MAGELNKAGKLLDFTDDSILGGGDGTFTQTVINIIEQNTGTQVSVEEGYKQITWVGGLPYTVEVWEDSSKTKKLWTNTYTFTDGVPTTVVVVNEDDGITTTETIVWLDGVPVSMTKV